LEPAAPRVRFGLMSDEADVATKRVWDLIESIGVCMLVTGSTDGLRARPLEPRPQRGAGLIWFLTDARSGKEGEIAAEHDVALVFFDAGRKAYLSITAEAWSFDDRSKAAQIWRSSDRLWWDGPDDPNLRVLRVAPQQAELWDGPSTKAATIFELGKAMVTGAKPDLGENRKVTLDLTIDAAAKP
jgi:general stress protein 26